MLKLTGLDDFSRQLSETSDALKELDGPLGTVRFNIDDRESIEAAIQQMNAMIDAKISRYAGNPILDPLAANLKEKYRAAILNNAAEARLRD